MHALILQRNFKAKPDMATCLLHGWSICCSPQLLIANVQFQKLSMAYNCNVSRTLTPNSSLSMLLHLRFFECWTLSGFLSCWLWILSWEFPPTMGCFWSHPFSCTGPLKSISHDLLCVGCWYHLYPVQKLSIQQNLFGDDAVNVLAQWPALFGMQVCFFHSLYHYCYQACLLHPFTPCKCSLLSPHIMPGCWSLSCFVGTGSTRQQTVKDPPT